MTLPDRRDGADVAHEGQRGRGGVDLAPAANGGCTLTLVHRIGAEWAEYADRTARGWGMLVDGIAAS